MISVLIDVGFRVNYVAVVVFKIIWWMLGLVEVQVGNARCGPIDMGDDSVGFDVEH